MKNVIVTLRVFKGKPSYDENGKLISENQTMKLTYGLLEWTNFLKTVRNIGTTKVVIVKCTDGNDPSYPEIAIPQVIQSDIDDCFKVPEASLTADQKKIKELEAKINAIAEAKQPVKEYVKEQPKEEVVISEDASDIEQLREKYEELYGEKPHPRMGIKKLNQKIAEKSV